MAGINSGWARMDYDFGLPYATLLVPMHSREGLELREWLEMHRDDPKGLSARIWTMVYSLRPDLRHGLVIVGMRADSRRHQPWEIQVVSHGLPRVKAGHSPSTQQLHPCARCAGPMGVDGEMVCHRYTASAVDPGRGKAETICLKCYTETTQPMVRVAEVKPGEGWGKAWEKMGQSILLEGQLETVETDLVYGGEQVSPGPPPDPVQDETWRDRSPLL